MTFAGLNYLAVVSAAVASFLIGWVWYGVLFSKAWMTAVGKSEADLKAQGSAAWPMALTFLAQLLMAWVLAGLIGHLGAGQVTLSNGVVSAAFCWLGFVGPTMAANHAFQGASRNLTLIDSGHWLLVLLIQGAIIGWFGV